MADQLRAMQRFRQVTKLGVIYNVSEPNSTLAVAQLRGLAAAVQVPACGRGSHLRAETGGGRGRAGDADLIAARPGFVYLPSDRP